MNYKGKTILLVEDDRIMALAEKKRLEKEGYNVCLASDGPEAIEAVQRNSPCIDMILMDIGLGYGMDGIEAARIILKDHDIPLIFLSSHTEIEIVEKMEEITSYGFVVKGAESYFLSASMRMAFKLFEANRQKDLALERLRLASSAAKLGVWDWNIKDNSMFWDDRMFELYGRNREDNLSVKIWTDSLHPDDLEEQGRELELALTGEKKFDTEFRVVRPDGTVRCIKAYGEVYRNQAGEPVRMTGINFDSTDKKLAEEKLTHSYNQLRYFIAHAGTGIAIFDRDMRYLYVSEQYLNEFNIKDRDPIGKCHYDVIPNIPERWKKIHQLALKGTASKCDEDVFEREDGTVDYTLWECSPWYESDGRVGGVILTAEKINEKVEARKLLEKYAAIFEKAKWGIIAVNAETERIELVNPEFLRMHGYTAEEIRLMTPGDLFSPEKREEFKRVLQKIKKTDHYSFESEHIRKDGTLFPVSIEISAIRDAEGKVLFRAANVIDITEKNKLELGIKESLHEKEILLKEIHHRVKNNLQVISSLLSLQTDMVNSENFADAFNDSRNRIKSMSIIHEKLYQSNNFTSINFGEYAADLISFLKNTYGTKALNVRFDYDFDNIQMGLDAAIPCGLILNELVSNAFKYAFVGEVPGVLTCSLKKDDSHIVIKVKDNGPGIDEEKNLLSAETLGLMMVNSLIVQLKATIELKNSGGAEFIIRIPAR